MRRHGRFYEIPRTKEKVVRLPWNMHMHRGENTLVGILPTRHGTFVRSWNDGCYDISWYPVEVPMGGESHRGQVRHVGRFSPAENAPASYGMEPSDQAVVDFMHEHPELSLLSFGDPHVQPLEWKHAEPGVRTRSDEHGSYVWIESNGMVEVTMVPAGGRANVSICRISDASSEEAVGRRVAERVRRHLAATTRPS